LLEESDALYREHLVRQEQAQQRAAAAAAARIRRRRVAEEAARRRLQQEQLMRPFPPPPIPGTDDIVPIISAAELLGEGVDQANCVDAIKRVLMHMARSLWEIGASSVEYGRGKETIRAVSDALSQVASKSRMFETVQAEEMCRTALDMLKVAGHDI